MNQNAILEKFRALHISTIVQLCSQHLTQNTSEKMTFDEQLSLLVDHQWED